MRTQPPLPLCKAFLVLAQIVDYPDGAVALVGLPRGFSKSAFPVATEVAFFARLASAHGQYQVEMQLQTADGEVVWREGPPSPWPLVDPLELYDLKLNKMCAVFPQAGRYDFVLLMNDEEVARQKFTAEFIPPMQP
jgi:hypothetical protein